MIIYYTLSLFFFIISILFLIMFNYMFYFKNSIFIEWQIFEINSMNINMLIYIDWMSMLFIFTILIISSMIMLYCCEYMSHDLYYTRFFYLMLIFIISMILLILSPNMISLMIGWDGLGLSSYCLIIYYQNYSSYNSGMLTVLMNRIGDIIIIISIALMLKFGSWNFMNFNNMDFKILFFIMLASFTKSAQFPFSHWLPAAMAAPTPVSSLVHSSTLVTAGIYLLIRFNNLIYQYNTLLMIISIISIHTMFFAGMSAIYTYDFKKIIAFSTLSQLGLMMLIFSFKEVNLTFFHLIIHAMFKSMMFMCSGIFIHTLNNFQDIRFMNNSMFMVPMTSMILFISNLSLCGFPFMSGFFSKDKILETLMLKNLNIYLYIMMMVSTGLTVIYSIRLLYYLMIKNFSFIPMMKIYDNKIMTYSMLLLLLFSIYLGSFLNWLIFFNIENSYFQIFEKMSILILCFMSLMIIKYNWKLKFKFYKFYFMSMFLGEMWFMYKMSSISIYFFYFSKIWKFLYEKGWSEYFMKNIFIYEISKSSSLIKNYEFYMLFMLFSFMMLIILIY
nr:NADH dehydrogenase subunit 5 [Odontofroggatia galili]